jgi:DnaJ-like protein
VRDHRFLLRQRVSALPTGGIRAWHGCCSLIGVAAQIHNRSRQEQLVNYTHYDYLDIAPGADRARIETAYLALIEKLQYGQTDAGQDLSGLVRRIHTAYEVLSHSDQRAAYDAKLAQEAEEADWELKSLLDQPHTHRHVQEVPAEYIAAATALAA